MKGIKLELTGQRIGKLTVIKDSGDRQGKCVMWLCECECGATLKVRASRLVGTCRGGIPQQSCGCHSFPFATPNRDRNNKFRDLHGLAGTPAYKSWSEMKRRCYNYNYKGYHRYGGRGIKVCKEWINNFPAFYDYMGPRDKGYGIDRIDNDGNYEPGNVRWVTVSENAKKMHREKSNDG